MALLQVALIGGASYALIQASRRRRRRPKWLERTQIRTSEATSHFRATLSELDDRYQRLVQTKLDPLLGGQARQAQLDSLSAESKLKTNDLIPDAGDAELNRYLALAGAVMGVAAVGQLLLPPLLPLALVGSLWLVWPVYVSGFQSIRQERRVKIELLSALYLSGLILLGYYVFVGVVSALFFIGTKILFQTESRSREGLSHIFGEQPRFVWRIVDGVEVQTSVVDLHAGDVIVVNAGEPLPVDGVIRQGNASVDQRLLTGEAQPVEKGPGDQVFAATLLLTGRVQIEVEKAGTETTAAQIGKILEETANYQTKIEARGLKIADQSALPTLLLSLLALPIRGPVGATAVLAAGFGINIRACSLLSTLSYLQIAARNGILIKDGRALERFQAVDTVVFDKTGTLTVEQPHVAAVHCCQPDWGEKTVLTYAAAAEYRQPHPIAQAILAAAAERGLPLPAIDEASYEVGYGIQVTIDRQRVCVGSDRFMRMEGIAIPPTLQSLQTTCQQQGYSLVMVAVDQQIVGALELHATLRPEVEAMIADLHRRGIKLAIISGDQEEPTRALAQSLGIDSYFANTLPENKAQLIAQLQTERRVVCFVGDGINDAIALKQADVSISLRGATTIATDTAQIVLMDQNLAKLGDILDLAENFEWSIQQGFLTTMIPGVIGIGGVFFLRFGIVAAELLFQVGFFTGLGIALFPLVKDQHQQKTDEPEQQ